MSKVKLVPSHVFEDYYHVPNNERLIITRQGRIIDLRIMASLIEVDSDTANYDYPVVNVMGQGTLHVHRLLAETFINPGMDTASLTVNHIDGNKRNNNLDNLEWVSRSDNLLHAYNAGLRSDNKPVLCKNVKTGEIKRYSSGADCARQLNVPVVVLRNYIAAKVPYLFDGLYELVYVGDNWRGISLENAIHVKPSDPAVVCVKNGKSMIFDTAESAGRFLGISETTVHRLIYNHNTPALKDHLFFKLTEVTSRVEDMVYIPGSFKDLKPSTKIKPITVKDLTTGHVTEWESTTAFARVVGINRSTIQKAIGKNDGKWNQYQFSYKTESPHSEKDE